MKKPVTQFLPLVLSSLAFAGVFSSWVLGCGPGTSTDLAGRWPATVTQHGQNHQPRDFLQKNDAWLRGQDRWNSNAGDASPEVSLNAWLRHEAVLLCNIYKKIGEPGTDGLDPENFCQGQGAEGMDPITPPQPCEWGECPERPEP